MSSSDKNPDKQSIPDVQSYEDSRRIAINRVGIKDIKHPVTVIDRLQQPQAVIGNFTMTVALPEDRKGTHMSRFTQLLNEHTQTVHSLANFVELFREMNRRLESSEGTIKMTFDYFINKIAPVSGVSGMLDYQVSLRADIERGKEAQSSVKVVVPVTTLCPCSKEISQYGAHNQRSHVTIDATPFGGKSFFWEDLIDYAESEASSQLYSQLKRSDEKLVTERAYENPKFVEDLIRDIALKLNADDRIECYTLEVENFESIHNHSAYAIISEDKTA